MSTKFENSAAIEILKEETKKMSSFFTEMDAKMSAAQEVQAESDPMSDEEFERLTIELNL
jgi:hypothetical protein